MRSLVDASRLSHPPADTYAMPASKIPGACDVESTGAEPHSTNARPEPAHSGPPGWTILGGAMLAGVAGYMNTCVIDLGHEAVTHLTGGLSRLSRDFATGDLRDGLLMLSIGAGFVTGAAISGAFIGGTTLRLGRPYGIAMLIESALLVIAAVTLPIAPWVALPVAAAAAGIQNGMASSYGKLILRTTHVTGIATDLGLLIGRRLRGNRIPRSSAIMLCALLTMFFVGGVWGWVGARSLGASALLIPASLLLVTGSGYLAWRKRWEKRRSRAQGGTD